LISPCDVPASELIEKLAKYLKDNVNEINPPSWASVVKTGIHVQRSPQDPKWWYTRCASLLRKVYIHGPVGVERLRAEYGGRKDYGVRPEHAAKASGAIIRKGLQQLQTAGFLEIYQSYGRIVTREGSKLLEEMAEETKKEVVKEIPALKKY
jgi:small subunit ribosomal protein S19e